MTNRLLNLLFFLSCCRDLVHRQTSMSAIQHIALGVYGFGCEDALTHLMNYVWPNIFETSPHVVQAFMGSIEGMRVGVGPSKILQYALQVPLLPIYSKTCLIWHLCNPFLCVIWYWFFITICLFFSGFFLGHVTWLKYYRFGIKRYPINLFFALCNLITSLFRHKMSFPLHVGLDRWHFNYIIAVLKLW